MKNIAPTIIMEEINPQKIIEVNKENDPWISMYTGRKFYPLNPRIEDIHIMDIAHALSNLCRFTGHVKHGFYSVAQHCVLVSHICPIEYALLGLLHDGSEYALTDLPSPLKRHPEFANYRKFEKALQSMIYRKFGLPEEEPATVKTADLQLLSTEMRDLMSPLHADVILPTKPLPFTIKPLNPTEAKDLFLERFKELVGDSKYAEYIRI